MALHTLRYRHNSEVDNFQEPKGGLVAYDGSSHSFHEWEFVTLAKVETSKDEDFPGLASEVVASLRGDALLVAMEIGRPKLLAKDDNKLLVETIHTRTPSAKQAEARELFRQGQRPDGPLTRASSESMTQYIGRRCRWWSMVTALDSSIGMSEALLGGCCSTTPG